MVSRGRGEVGLRSARNGIEGWREGGRKMRYNEMRSRRRIGMRNTKEWD